MQLRNGCAVPLEPRKRLRTWPVCSQPTVATATRNQFHQRPCKSKAACRAGQASVKITCICDTGQPRLLSNSFALLSSPRPAHLQSRQLFQSCHSLSLLSAVFFSSFLVVCCCCCRRRRRPRRRRSPLPFFSSLTLSNSNSPCRSFIFILILSTVPDAIFIRKDNNLQTTHLSIGGLIQLSLPGPEEEESNHQPIASRPESLFLPPRRLAPTTASNREREPPARCMQSSRNVARSTRSWCLSATLEPPRAPSTSSPIPPN